MQVVIHGIRKSATLIASRCDGPIPHHNEELNDAICVKFLTNVTLRTAAENRFFYEKINSPSSPQRRALKEPYYSGQTKSHAECNPLH